MNQQDQKVKILIESIMKDGAGESISVEGTYSCRGNLHCLKYIESNEDLIGTETTIVIQENVHRATLTRKGFVNNKMTFNPGHSEELYYETPYGAIFMEIETDSVHFVPGQMGYDCIILYKIIMGGDRSTMEKKDMRIRVRYK